MRCLSPGFIERSWIFASSIVGFIMSKAFCRQRALGCIGYFAGKEVLSRDSVHPTPSLYVCWSSASIHLEALLGLNTTNCSAAFPQCRSREIGRNSLTEEARLPNLVIPNCALSCKLRLVKYGKKSVLLEKLSCTSFHYFPAKNFSETF